MSDSKHFTETRVRSLTKTVSWRFVAVMNSFTILTLSFSERPLTNAIAMNISGFFAFYIFERVWNMIYWGRIPGDAPNEAIRPN